MLRLSNEIGQFVQRSDGSTLGRLIDLTVDLDDDEPVVRRLVVGTRQQIRHFVAWDAVESFEHTLVQLEPAAPVLPVHTSLSDDLSLDHGELLLRRDVLDTQVVDVVGARLARVSDVLLTRRADQCLVVGAVDIGFGATCRRLGLRRLAERLPEQAVAWSALHLTSARGHQVQLGTPKAAVHRLDGQELAMLLSRLSIAAGAAVLSTVDPAKAGAALTVSHDELVRPLMAAIDDQELDRALDALPGREAERLRSIRGEPRTRTYLRHRRRRRRPSPSNQGGHDPRHRDQVP